MNLDEGGLVMQDLGCLLNSLFVSKLFLQPLD